VLLGDAMDKVLDRIDAATPDDEDLDEFDDSFPTDPTEPPDSWPGSAAAGWVMAPISGGAPTEEDERWWAEQTAEHAPHAPTAEDLAEMRAHFDRVDQTLPMYGYE
jgi:hypothetical protein